MTSPTQAAGGGATPRDPSAGPPPTIQIHPTRRCNLKCLHCYSVSGPDERDLLPVGLLMGALDDAAGHGYRVASFSGGEPILYAPLGHLLSHAKQLGMRTTVTSNGMLLAGRRLEALVGCTDVLAISLDGVPESHNRMRASDRAFERMAANLDAVRKAGIDFGFIFTLTQHNVDELAWCARFALDQGARLFQIHPLEEVGRAADDLQGSRPDEVEMAFAVLVADRIRRLFGNRLFVQVDIFHRDLVRMYPHRFFADPQPSPPDLLSDCAHPLVVESDGTVAPLGCGFSRRYALGSLFDDRLRDLAPRWIARNYADFRALCRRAYDEACQPSDLPFLNWYELVGLRASEPERSLVSLY